MGVWKSWNGNYAKPGLVHGLDSYVNHVKANVTYICMEEIDLANWLQLLMNNGKSDDEVILRKARGKVNTGIQMAGDKMEWISYLFLPDFCQRIHRWPSSKELFFMGYINYIVDFLRNAFQN